MNLMNARTSSNLQNKMYVMEYRHFWQQRQVDILSPLDIIIRHTDIRNKIYGFAVVAIMCDPYSRHFKIKQCKFLYVHCIPEMWFLLFNVVEISFKPISKRTLLIRCDGYMYV